MTTQDGHCPDDVYLTAWDATKDHELTTSKRALLSPLGQGRWENVATCRCGEEFRWDTRLRDHLSHQRHVLAEVVWRLAKERADA